MNKCNVLECVRKYYAKSFCELHYRRNKVHKHPQCSKVPQLYHKNIPDDQRFWNFVCKNTIDECWLWIGGKHELGYGRFYLNGDKVPAHRFSYILAYGQIPKGIVIDHLCRTPSCVNPLHLEAVTQRVNMSRGVIQERFKKWAASITHCPQGHEYTPENTQVYKNNRTCKECRRIRKRAKTIR